MSNPERSIIDQKLTHKQRDFSEIYAATGSEVKAALLAGYSATEGQQHLSRLVQDARLMLSVRDRNQSALECLGLDINWRAKQLKAVVEDGFSTGKLGIVLQALDMMNKMCGDYAPTVTENTNRNLNVAANIEQARELVAQYKSDK